MGKKRSRQQQSSNVSVGADSSESGDGATDKISTNKPVCSHVTKSIECNQIKKKKSLYVNGKKQCIHCKDSIEEDNKNVEGSEDFWICLRCGVKTCTVEHSLMHYGVPRSDSHALTLKVPAFTVWCHTCKADIPSGYNKKLKTCISSVEQLYNKQINLQPLAQQESESSCRKDENIKRGNKPNEQFIQNPSKKNGAQKAASMAPSVRGLTNLGNTCFFNSVLQCLAQTPGLVEAIREMSTPDQHVDISVKSGKVLSGTLGQWDDLSECLADTLVKLQSGGPVVSPGRLLSLLTKRQPQFQGYQQHDAHELFTYLIDSVRMGDQKRYRKLILSEFGLYGNVKQLQKDKEETTKKIIKALDHEVAEIISFVPEKVFRGRLVNRIECQECRSVKTFEETFLDLSLPIVADKPQPPCMRRKGGHQPYIHQSQPESIKNESKNGEINSTAETTMTKSQLKREKRLQRKKNKKQGKITRESKKVETEDSAPIASEQVAEEFKDDNEEQQVSDIEGDIEDNSEETNCGSKGSSFPKSHESGSSSHIATSQVNCGNQGVWLDSNDSLSTRSFNKEKIDKPHEECNHISVDSQEENKHMIEDLFGTTGSISFQAKDNSLNQTLCSSKEETNLMCSQTNELEGSKLIECNDQGNSSKAQVTAWLNSSNLISIPDSEEVHKEISPNVQDISNTEVSVSEASFNKILPQAQSSVCYNQQKISLPLDESRSAPQETQESGYCSEKPGCAESPQRNDSSIGTSDMLSTSSCSTLTSSEEDIFKNVIFELFKNGITGGNTQEDRSTENAEIVVESTTKLNEVPQCSVINEEKCGNWLSSCHFPAYVRRRPPSPPVRKSAALTNAIQANGTSSTIMCSKWIEETSKLPTFEEEEEEEEGGGGSTELLNEKLSTVEGLTRGKKCDIKEASHERGLGDIEEEESSSKFNGVLNLTCGPLNQFQSSMGDMEASDTNSNDINQGMIARPASPHEQYNELSDLKDVKVNTIQEEQRLGDLEKDSPLLENDNKKAEERSQNMKVNHGRGDNADSGMTCGCNRVSLQKQESDKCCLHTSLAQSTQAELMTGCNKIACENCSSDGKVVNTNSTKQTLICEAPPALVIHLKRFQVQMMSCRKLSRHVSFPLQLDLAPYSVPLADNKQKEENGIENDNSTLLYNLYGLVEHCGTMNGGHYVAYIKMTRDNATCWYCISDSHVSQVTETRVLSAQAYLLFYKRIKT